MPETWNLLPFTSPKRETVRKGYMHSKNIRRTNVLTRGEGSSVRCSVPVPWLETTYYTRTFFPINSESPGRTGLRGTLWEREKREPPVYDFYLLPDDSPSSDLRAYWCSQPTVEVWVSVPVCSVPSLYLKRTYFGHSTSPDRQYRRW